MPPTPDPPPRPEPPAAPRLRRSSLREQVLDALREAIASAELAPGSLHSAPALAERFAVSATPVREAMLELSREGAVEAVPNKGFRVVPYSAREREELADLRALVEAPLARRAAGRAAGHPEAVAGLRRAAADGVRTVGDADGAAWGRSELAFHAAVLALAGNGEAVAVAADLQRRALRPIAAVAPGGGRDTAAGRTGTGPVPEAAGRRGGVPAAAAAAARSRAQQAAERRTAAAEHVELADLIAAGAGEAAEELMRRHCGQGARVPPQRAR